MPKLNFIPEVYSCCGFVTDLRAASAIIAVIGIVTSPVVSWSMIRHSYIIHVACFVSTSTDRPDVVDVSFRNVISFGFGMNAGMGNSCLSKDVTAKRELFAFSSIVDDSKSSGLLKFVKGFGWAVLVVDIIFVVSGTYFLIRIFKHPTQLSALVYMITAFVSNLFSCIYGIIYVTICAVLGGSFPLFELFFAIFDLALWCYFIVVINSFRLNMDAKPPSTQTGPVGPNRAPSQMLNTLR